MGDFQKWKEEGNKAYGAKDFERAVELYSKVSLLASYLPRSLRRIDHIKFDYINIILFVMLICGNSAS